MQLVEAVGMIPGFAAWNHAERVKYFAWFLHTYKGKEYFTAGDIEKCFDELSIHGPTSIGSFLSAMEKRRPKEALKAAKGYKLEKRVREALDTKYGQREITVAVQNMLAELPSKVPGINERVFLDEALTCFKFGAFRAAIVMTWNLAYDHFMRWLLSDGARLRSFNAQLPISYPKAGVLAITSLDDFSFLKEDQVLTVAKNAKLISVTLHKVMKEKLDRRNTAAHPSDVVVHQVTAEDCIKDLVENVVLMLK
jgi:hypothetical protein